MPLPIDYYHGCTSSGVVLNFLRWCEGEGVVLAKAGCMLSPEEVEQVILKCWPPAPKGFVRILRIEEEVPIWQAFCPQEGCRGNVFGMQYGGFFPQCPYCRENFQVVIEPYEPEEGVNEKTQ